MSYFQAHGFFKSLAINTAGDQLRNSGVKFALETYLKFVPNDHEAQMLGLVDFWDYKYDEAIAHYNRAIAFSDNYPPYYANRSMIHYHNNNLPKALEDITFAINLNDEVDYIKQRIIYLIENGQYNKAIEDVNYLLRFGGQSPMQTAAFYNYRGDAYWQLNQKSKACLDWKKSIGLQRDKNIVVKIKTNCQ